MSDKHNYQGLTLGDCDIEALRRAADDRGVNINVNETHGEFGYTASEEEHEAIQRNRKKYKEDGCLSAIVLFLVPASVGILHIIQSLAV